MYLLHDAPLFNAREIYILSCCFFLGKISRVILIGEGPIYKKLKLISNVWALGCVCFYMFFLFVFVTKRLKITKSPSKMSLSANGYFSADIKSAQRAL